MRIKKLLWFIMSVVSYIVLTPLLLISSICATWFILPDFQTTFIGEWIQTLMPGHTMILLTVAVTGCSALFYALTKIFKIVKSSKANNFYTHLITWLLAILLAAESLFTLFATNSSMIETSFDFTLTRKIGIVAGAIGLLLYSLLAPKIRRIVDRRLQAYDTAKELNQAGRSSVVFIQILKTLDFCCPELILMTVLCFAFSFRIAMYFIYVIAAFLIPVIGNMICDARVKEEAKRREAEKTEAQINATAEAVVDLLQQRGKQ